MLEPSMISGERGLGKCPSAPKAHQAPSNRLARDRILKALSSENDNSSRSETDAILENTTIILQLDEQVEHILIRERHAKLLGLSMNADTVKVAGLGQLFVVVDRAQFAAQKKPAPISRQSSHASMLADQLSQLNLQRVV